MVIVWGRLNGRMEKDRYSYEYVLKINVLTYENGMDYGSFSKAINTLHNNLLPKTYYLNYCPEYKNFGCMGDL